MCICKIYNYNIFICTYYVILYVYYMLHKQKQTYIHIWYIYLIYIDIYSLYICIYKGYIYIYIYIYISQRVYILL